MAADARMLLMVLLQLLLLLSAAAAAAARHLRDLIFLAAGAHSQNSTTSADCLQAFQTAVDGVQPADR